MGKTFIIKQDLKCIFGNCVFCERDGVGASCNVPLGANSDTVTTCPQGLSFPQRHLKLLLNLKSWMALAMLFFLNIGVVDPA